MRTTIDINDRLLKEAWQLVRPKSKRQLIEISLEELIRKEHLKSLTSRFGQMPMISRRQLLSRRRRG